MALSFSLSLGRSLSSSTSIPGSFLIRGASSQIPILKPIDALKLVLEVKEKLERDHPSLPVGKSGRDDEDMIFWFLKDRKFHVEDAAGKLAKAVRWHEEFGVSELSEESLKSIAATGKAYLHTFPDVDGRQVLVVVASKHFPGQKQDSAENEKLCGFLIEKALSKLPDGKEEILGIFDLRGFSTENGDIGFLKFLIDMFYTYYPRIGAGPIC